MTVEFYRNYSQYKIPHSFFGSISHLHKEHDSYKMDVRLVPIISNNYSDRVRHGFKFR